LEDFDEIMGAESEQMAQQGIGSAADEIFREVGAIGSGSNSGSNSGSSSGGASAGADDEQLSGASGGGNVNTSGGGDSSSGGGSVFEQSARQDRTSPQIEGCEDENKVARQLCEAATEEEDPFLRAALWEEYNEYKRILGRQ
jgi:hypothetical protein